jgi:hypothetical protein
MQDSPSRLACDHRIYELTCLACCLRLLRTAPPGGPRRAMYAHLLMSCTDEQIEAVTAAAREEGLTCR